MAKEARDARHRHQKVVVKTFIECFDSMVTLVTANEVSSKNHEETTKRDLKNFQNHFEEKSCP